jgi:ketol-acid reductoisomerase
MEQMYRSVLTDIADGGFAKRFQQELADGYPTGATIRELIAADNPMAAAEDRVRSSAAGAPARAGRARPSNL